MAAKLQLQHGKDKDQEAGMDAVLHRANSASVECREKGWQAVRTRPHINHAGHMNMLLCAEGFTTEHLMAWQAHETVCDVVSNRGLTTEHLMAGAGHGAGVRQDVSGEHAST